MKKSENTVQPIFLKNYKAHDFKINHVNLEFILDPENTIVISEMFIEKKNLNAKNLELDGENLELIEISYEDNQLSKDSYEVLEKGLKVFNITETKFKLTTKCKINPKNNLALEGLYLSGSILCTQNEPEGFRRITYFIDRPDNMATYQVEIIADKKKYPVLLANGNCIDKGDLENGKHWTKWQDPFPKPSYLFALVAGDLGIIEDAYTTKSGREVQLSIYCDPGDEEKCHFAMESLKNSMKWDEERFDLEYDLDQYMIVSVSSFNAGAMENKGLNIFNSALVLANQKTATDGDYLSIESVIGHEYFHNWTGNRVTCRDWFQLTLKEGLTVFRDQEFSSDLHSRFVQRIQDVRRLKEAQFPEDASPMAHSIRPESYVQINNFYTATVYEKGAEVIRMIHTLVGEAGFQKGMKKYFELYDGKAVTTEDFLNAMKLTNPHLNDSLFKNWYSQAGTPAVEFNESFDPASKTLKLSYKQTCPQTAETESKKPFLIPIKIGFLNEEGKEIKPKLQDKSQEYWNQNVIALTEFEGTIQFSNIESRPILSLNRSFSAPVNIKKETSLDDQLHLLKYDQDHFNKYEVAQNISKDWILNFITNNETQLNPKIISAFSEVINDKNVDDRMKSLILSAPTESVLHQSQKPIDFKKTKAARDSFQDQIAKAFEVQFLSIYNSLKSKTQGGFSPEKVGSRALKNLCLSYLARLKSTYKDLVFSHFENADNMTDEFTGIYLINGFFTDHSQSANQSFYQKWKDDDLVLQKWIVTQLQSADETFYDKTLEISNMKEYSDSVPNYVRSLWGSFSRNFVMFHHESGQAYEMMADQIIKLDKINRSIAAALTKTFRIKPSVSEVNRNLINIQLKKILETKDLSSNVAEVATQILNA